MHLRRLLFLTFITALFAVRSVTADSSVALPENSHLPSLGPMQVQTSLFVWDLFNIIEKEGTFEADVYLMLQWNDPRLAFQGTEALLYVEDNAVERLKTMWWPQLDFVNSSKSDTRNLVLSIENDGSVTYSAKIKGTFFVDMDFRKFPFDKQNFDIRLQSFFWDDSQLQFVGNNDSAAFIKTPEVEGLQIEDISVSISRQLYPLMNEFYSEYKATIHLKRSPSFFLYQILIPLTIILGMACCMFYLRIEDLANRLTLGQSAILVLVAMKFLINQDLPQIDYLTIIDYIFFVAYLSAGLTVILSVVDFKLWKVHNDLSATLNKRVAWMPLLLFFILYILLLIIAKVF